MAEQCPLECPNIIECERRVDAFADRSIQLLRIQGLIEDLSRVDRSLASGVRASRGNVYVHDPEYEVSETHNLTEEIAVDIRRNAALLTQAQEAAPEVHEAASQCETGPVPTLLGRLSLWKVRIGHKRQLTAAETEAHLRSDPRYLKCGNRASKAALRNVPLPD